MIINLFEISTAIVSTVLPNHSKASKIHWSRHHLGHPAMRKVLEGWVSGDYSALGLLWTNSTTVGGWTYDWYYKPPSSSQHCSVDIDVCSSINQRSQILEEQMKPRTSHHLGKFPPFPVVVWIKAETDKLRTSNKHINCWLRCSATTLATLDRQGRSALSGIGTCLMISCNFPTKNWWNYCHCQAPIWPRFSHQ